MKTIEVLDGQLERWGGGALPEAAAVTATCACARAGRFA